MIAFMFDFSFRIEFIDFFVVFIEDGGARANLIFQAAAPDSAAFPAPAVQAAAAVAIFFFINVQHPAWSRFFEMISFWASRKVKEKE